MPPGKKKEKRPRVRVRMYRQGLGDCFLVTFQTPAGPVHAVIDCGTLGATTTDADVDRVLDVLPGAVARLRDLGS